MTVRSHKQQTFATSLVPEAPAVPETPSFMETATAAFGLENDVVAVWDLATRPEYEDDPAFDGLARTKASPYWGSPWQDNFAEARSAAHWDAIASRITREQKQRETLDAAGWTGVGLQMFAGLVSPTMFIPAVGPYRGLKGVGTAALLGAGAAAAQEIPLSLAQETRTTAESLTAIGAGAFLGGVMGTAHVTWQALADYRAKVHAELDMAMTENGKAISPAAFLTRQAYTVTGNAGEAIIEPGAIRATTFNFGDTTGRRFVVARGEDLEATALVPQDLKVLNKTQVEMGTETAGVYESPAANTVRQNAIRDGYDAIRYKDTEGNTVVEVLRPEALAQTADDFAVVQDGPLIQTPSSVGAAANSDDWRYTDAGGLKAAPGINALAQVSPVARVIAQNEFPTARRMMSKLSLGGLRLEGNAVGRIGAPGGTVEYLTHLYDSHIATLVRTIDEHYADYLYNGRVTAPFPATRASFRSAFRFTGGKLSKEEFQTEVARAIQDGGVHDIEQVAKAATILHNEIEEPILKQAQQVGLFDAGDLQGDIWHLARQYARNKIDADPIGFTNVLAKNYERVLQEDVAKATERSQAQHKILQEFLDDVELDAKAAKARQEEFTARLEALGETDDEIALKALRRERRQVRKFLKQAQSEGTRIDENGQPYSPKEGIQARLDEIQAQIKALEESAAAQLEEKRGLRRRLRNLNRAYWAVEEKRAKQLELLDSIEDDALNSLRRVVNSGRRLQRDMDKLEPRMLRRKAEHLITQVRNGNETLGRRLRTLRRRAANGDADFIEAADAFIKTEQRLTALDARLADAEDLLDNRQVLTELLDDITMEANESTNLLNLRRGERMARIKEKVKKLDPERAKKLGNEARATQAARDATTYERFRELGVDDLDLQTGEAAVAAVARSRAESVVAKIMKLNNRIAGLDIIGEERGSELARVLQVPSRDIFPWLETDVVKVIRNYVRQVSADIELKRAFGDVDAKEAFKQLEEEYFARARQMEAAGASKDEIAKMTARFRGYERALTASIARLRHTYGIPSNPEGFAARAGKVMLDLSTLRFMGSVAVSSVPDMGRSVMRHGFARSYRDGLVPFITNLKAWKMSANELRLAGGAMDGIIHSRAAGFMDILDQYVGKSVPERAIHTLATRMGNIAGFSQWTDFMKSMAGVIENAALLDSIEGIATGRLKGKDLRKATEYLASLNIDSTRALRMWDEVQQGGGGKVNGVWWPNTEDWKDPGLVREYRAALRMAVDNTIITPGLELPLITNESLGARMLFQFKSFALSSHSKTVMAGLQQRDMALMNGAAFSLALGMVSYYIWAQTVGGDARKEMEQAGFDKWLDEGISRAGFLGPLGEIQRVMERVPLVAPYANFSGQRSTNRAGANLVEALLGPSFDTLGTAANVITGLDDPTQSTVHQLRTLLPLQNVFYLRALFDLMEQSTAADLPERRQ